MTELTPVTWYQMVLSLLIAWWQVRVTSDAIPDSLYTETLYERGIEIDVNVR